MVQQMTVCNSIGPLPPLISIIIPAYNHDRFIAETIQSALDQSYENLELIIINDGSTDGTHDEITKLEQACLKRFRDYTYINRENRGLASTLNESIHLAKGKYVMPIASDDILLQGKCSLLLPLLEADENLAAVFGSVVYIDNDSRVLRYQTGIEHMHNFDELLMNEFIPPAPAGLLRKSSILNVGCYDPDIKIDDWYMWLKLTYTGLSLRSISENVVKYRMHPTNTVNNYRLINAESIRILENYREHPLFNMAVSKANWASAKSASYFSDVGFTYLVLQKVIHVTFMNKLTCFIFSIIPKPRKIGRFIRKIVTRLKIDF